jgi:4-amino-4-deoxy-L-arabinose transferase-like glycosyltransferase
VSRLPKGLVLAVAAVTLARAALAAVVPLTVDEAYYVQWAAHLAPGYLDHPPLVGWLAAAGLLAGRTALAVRLPALLLQGATTLLAADLARARAGERGAWAAFLLLQAAPVFSLGGLLETPDAPLALAWVGTLWAVDRALREDPRWLLAAGLFLGVGGLSKITAGALAVAVLAALLASASGRALFATRWPWLGAALALAVASPALAWNAAHGWANVTFQAGHGLGGRSFSAGRLAAALGGQAAYVSPVLLLACLPPAARALRAQDPFLRVAGATALPVVVGFTVAAAFTPGALPHWPAPGWLSALLLLALVGAPLLRAAVATGLGLQLAAALLALAPLRLAHDPRDEVRGWREGALAAEAAAGGRTLAATHWIALGQLGWYAHGPVVYAGERPCAATLWEPDPRAAGRPLLVVAVDGLGPDRAALERRLGPLGEAGWFEARDGERVVRRYRFFRWDPAMAAVTRGASSP